MRTAICGFLLGAVFLGRPSASSDAQCVTFDNPEELLARSDAVFLGTVLTTEATGRQGDHVNVDIATFRVERTWKGELTSTVRIGADRPFERNRQYLVFAAGQPLATSLLCRWTEPRERATTKISWLSKRLPA